MRRRLLHVTVAAVGALAIAGCRSDGRELRAPSAPLPPTTTTTTLPLDPAVP